MLNKPPVPEGFVQNVPANALPNRAPDRASLEETDQQDVPVSGKERIPWVDAARGIVIILVMIIHAHGTIYAVYKWVLALPMPIFFFLAGFVTAEKSLSRPLSRFIPRQTKRILLPYLIGGLLTYLPWVLFFRKHGASSEVPPLKPVLGMLYGVGIDNYLVHNIALWFLPAFFITKILLWCMGRFETVYARVGVLFLFVLIGHVASELSPVRLPWSAEMAAIALAFTGCGFLLNAYAGDRIAKIGISGARPFHLVPLLLFLFSITVLTAWRNDFIDMNYNSYGDIALFHLNAFSGIFMVLVLSMLIPGRRILSYIGTNTFVLYVFHLLAFKIISGIAFSVLHLPKDFRETYAFAPFLYVIIALMILLPVSPFLTRALNFDWKRSRPVPSLQPES